MHVEVRPEPVRVDILGDDPPREGIVGLNEFLRGDVHAGTTNPQLDATEPVERNVRLEKEIAVHVAGVREHVLRRTEGIGGVGGAAEIEQRIL